MTKTRKKFQPYPYRILPLTGNVTTTKGCPPLLVNEFFLIEALLRSEPMMAAYRAGGPAAVKEFFRARGIIGQNPLKGSHHTLLVGPWEKEWNRSLAPLGYLDPTLGIIDLAVLAKVNPDAHVTRKGTTVYGSSQGFDDCLRYLRDPNPRFLNLRVDAWPPPKATLRRLGVLVKERHREVRSASRAGHDFFGQRNAKTHVRRIGTWLKALQCYDLRRSGLEPKGIREVVFPSEKDTGRERVRLAIRRVQEMIDAAIQGNWPPHHIR